MMRKVERDDRERDGRGFGGGFGGGGRFGDRERGPRRDREDRAPREASETPAAATEE